MWELRRRNGEEMPSIAYFMTTHRELEVPGTRDARTQLPLGFQLTHSCGKVRGRSEIASHYAEDAAEMRGNSNLFLSLK